jgi:hypothetical protein
MPVLKDFIISMTVTAENILEWVQTNKELIQSIVKGVVGALGVFFSIIGKVLKIVFKLRYAIGILIVAMGAYRAALMAIIAIQWIQYLKMMFPVIMAAVKAQWALNVAMTANPIGLIVAGVAALAAGVYIVYKYWDDILLALQRAVEWVMKFLGLMPKGEVKLTNLEKKMGITLEQKTAEVNGTTAAGKKAINGTNKSTVDINVKAKDGAEATVGGVKNSGKAKVNAKTNNGNTFFTQAVTWE